MTQHQLPLHQDGPGVGYVVVQSWSTSTPPAYRVHEPLYGSLADAQAAAETLARHRLPDGGEPVWRHDGRHWCLELFRSWYAPTYLTVWPVSHA